MFATTLAAKRPAVTARVATLTNQSHRGAPPMTHDSVAPTLIEATGTLTEGVVLIPAADPTARAALETYLAHTDDRQTTAQLQTLLEGTGDRR